MRFAYADPPYIGQAKRHYSKEAVCKEVNHSLLVAHLINDFPDGWALSCSSPSLREILPLCPPDVRVMAWVKPFAIFKPNVNPGYCWEPVIVRGGRKRERTQPTLRDWVSANVVIRGGLHGSKPEPFCYWLFEVLGMILADEIVDLFPGTGILTRARERHRRQRGLFVAPAEQLEIEVTP